VERERPCFGVLVVGLFQNSDRNVLKKKKKMMIMMTTDKEMKRGGERGSKSRRRMRRRRRKRRKKYPLTHKKTLVFARGPIVYKPNL